MPSRIYSMFEAINDKVDELVRADLIVRRLPAGEAIGDGPSDPFGMHMYVSQMFYDGVQPMEVMAGVYPMADQIAKMVNNFQMLDVAPLPMPNGSDCLCEIFNDRRIPIRVTAVYDIVKSGTRVYVDTLVRMSGIHHLTVINGSLHLAKFPFVKPPEDDKLIEYVFYPWRNPGYEVLDQTSGEYTMLPDLDPTYKRPSYRQSYRVAEPYLYYTGETINFD